MILELIVRHWEMLDALLATVGLVIYVAASHSLNQRRHPSAAVAWVLAILLLPIVGLPLYLAFGVRKVVPTRAASSLPPSLPSPSPQGQATAARTQRLAQAMALPAPVAYEQLTIHADGAESLAALRRLIDGAQRTLEVSTFLFGRDALGREIAERLQQRARAGVRVRLLIDGIGIYMGGYPDLSALREANVEVLRFVSPFRSPKRGRTNLRNHRKMLIADGRCLWCGGRNLAAEYFEGDAASLRAPRPWVDLSFDLCGSLAAHARQQFELDWAFASEKSLAEVFPPSAPAGPSSGQAQLITSGPDRADDTIHTLLVSACFTSQRRILAITPYFVPDPVLLTAMTLASRRGVQVDLILPAHSNHRLADFARHRALRELACAGGQVWLHPEMVHAKAVIVDDDLALAGSANLDGRSLFINYEMMVAFYDLPAVRAFGRWGKQRRSECRPYVARRPGVVRELAEGLLLWLAFQL